MYCVLVPHCFVNSMSVETRNDDVWRVWWHPLTRSHIVEACFSVVPVAFLFVVPLFVNTHGDYFLLGCVAFPKYRLQRTAMGFFLGCCMISDSLEPGFEFRVVVEVLVFGFGSCLVFDLVET